MIFCSRVIKMTVRINMKGQDYLQDTGPLVKAFFPYAAIVSDGAAGTEKEEGAPDLVLDFDLYESRIEIDIRDGKVNHHITDDFSVHNPRIYENSGIPDRRMYRNHLHRALYTGLSEITGKTLPWGTLTGVRPTKQAMEMGRVGYSENDIVRYFEEEYLASPEKGRLAVKVTENERKLLDGIDFASTYSLYIGIPFCPSICLYCSFSSYPLGQYEKSVEPYVAALMKEIRETQTLFKDKKLISIYFGGGTPTTLSADQLERVINCIKECFDLSCLKEWTVEAGRPDSITEEKLMVLKKAGIDRISVNPQSMQQKTLDLVGRRHTVTDVISAYNLARRCGFTNINMDLIAGLNGETAEDFRDTMEQITALAPDSVTVHTLAVKRAARLNRDMDMYRDSMADDTAIMTLVAAEILQKNGYEPYYLYRQKNMSDNLENVGYARPGKEGLYNVLIMEECHTIAACGAGGSSKLVRQDEAFGCGFLNESEDNEYTVRKIERCENVKSVKDYIERIDEMTERKRKLFS